MNILSIDVSGNYSSISLLIGDEVNTFTQTHARKDRPDWDTLFSRIGFNSKEGFDNLDALAFARGPGSYTALRITASFLKAIAVAKHLPLIAISNLDSLAHEARHWINDAQAKILVAIEADAKESYFCSYQKNKDEIVPLATESVLSMEDLSDLANQGECYFVGTGWPESTQSHPNYLSKAIGSSESIAIIAKQKFNTGNIFDPEDANPVYLKTPEYQKK